MNFSAVIPLKRMEPDFMTASLGMVLMVTLTVAVLVCFGNLLFRGFSVT